ncbi:CoA-transferase [Halomonas sp. CUBES01]|uniref:CoA-transferase n=1 Tax=Halomonas sp. CUBES01 TaxID=2897340 RepID=UPI001E405793|nr:CoA-transferase [Halomonas sp. CUBES01]MEC4766355.1 CoA-transferase [Halomonas sp. CUBES01]
MESVTPSQAISMIPSGAAIAPGGFGSCGHPDLLTKAIEESFLKHGKPRSLKLLFASGAGDNNGRGLDRLAHSGLIESAVGGYWNLCPKLSAMGESGEISAHNWPQGVVSKLFTTIAEGGPGVITKVGLNTFVDPRFEGGVFDLNKTKPLVEVIGLKGKEYLFYPSQKVDVALIRGTVSDRFGNISMRSEASKMDALAQAQAARNSNGIVLVQVEAIQHGKINIHEVDIPGHLVDAVVTSKGVDHPFTYGHEGCPEVEDIEYKEDLGRIRIVNRTLEELPVGPYQKRVINFGIGIPAEIGRSMSEDQRASYTLTIESGVVGGSPLFGNSFGASINPDAIIDQAQLFTFYDGGGIDKAFLGFAQIDAKGRVNVSRFQDRRPGAGGFINITASAKEIIFCGTLVATPSGCRNANSLAKIVEHLDQVTFDPSYSNASKIKIITDRAVFEIDSNGLILTEIFEGLKPTDIRKLTDADFEISSELSVMNAYAGSI